MIKRTIHTIITLLVIIICVLVGVVIFALDGVVKHGYNAAAPKFLGVSTHLGQVRAKPFRGNVVLGDLAIGNPEGYKASNLMTLGGLTIDVDLASLLTDTIVIKEILISDLHVTYEQGLTSNNLMTLVNNLSADTPTGGKKGKAEKSPAKKIIIRKLDIVGGKVNMTVTLAQGHTLSTPLPPIHLTNLGESGKALDAVEATREILQAIQKAIMESATHTGGMVGDGVKALGHGVTEAGKTAVSEASGLASNAVDGVKNAAGAVKGFFK